jgi:hypothetical protein
MEQRLKSPHENQERGLPCLGDNFLNNNVVAKFGLASLESTYILVQIGTNFDF